jgi:hypothetical protein
MPSSTGKAISHGVAVRRRSESRDPAPQQAQADEQRAHAHTKIGQALGHRPVARRVGPIADQQRDGHPGRHHCGALPATHKGHGRVEGCRVS